MTFAGGLERTARADRRPGPRDPLIGAALGAVSGVAVFWLMHRALGDDALISVSFARTLAESGTWGVYPGITANTQTSPLNAWLLAAGIALVGHPMLIVGGVLCACLAGCGWLATVLARLLGVHTAAGWLIVAVLGSSPVLVATVGLETYLAGVALLGVAFTAIDGRVTTTGVVCGLAVLTRPDLAVPAGVLALGLVVVAGSSPAARGPHPPTVLARTAGIAALVALPWHVWSWFALGGAVPDTTWVRTGDRSGPTVLEAVPGWVEAFPVAGTASALPVVLALGCVVLAVRRIREAWARTVVLLVAAGWAHLAALALIGAQGAGWYYGPAVTCSTVALGLTAGAVGIGAIRAGLVVVGALVTAGVLAAGPAPWTWAPLVANLGRTPQYAAIAQQLPALTGGEPVEGPGEVGALAFYGSVPVLDFLTEPAQTDRVMARRAAGGGALAILMTWNGVHRHSAPPITTRWRLSFASLTPPPGRVVSAWPVDTPRRGRDSVVLIDRGPSPRPTGMPPAG